MAGDPWNPAVASNVDNVFLSAANELDSMSNFAETNVATERNWQPGYSVAPSTAHPESDEDRAWRLFNSNKLPAHSHNEYHQHPAGMAVVTDTHIGLESPCNSPACDTPDCDQPDCPTAIPEVFSCTDAACLQSSRALTVAPNGELCAGPLSDEIIEGAVRLTSLHSSMYANPNGHNIQNEYCDGLQGLFNLKDPSAPHPNHEGCTYNHDIFNQGLTYGTHNLVPYYPNNFNNGHDELSHFENALVHQYHNDAYNSSIQYPSQQILTMADPSSRSSSSSSLNEAHSFTFSNSETPSTSSPYSSSNGLYSDSMAFHAKSLLPAPSIDTVSRDLENIPRCEWANESGVCCDQTFPTKGELQEHMQTIHTASLSKSAGFICRWKGCARSNLTPEKEGFAQRSKLDRHIQSHTGYKASVCDECHREFSTAQTLDSHKRTHSGLKPFACTEEGCNYRAAQASQLTMHKRTKHTKDKPLICNFPGCESRFAESSNLSKHRKIHQSEEPCKCHHCFKTFRRQDQLKRHLKTHSKKTDVGILKGNLKRSSSQDLSSSTYFESMDMDFTQQSAVNINDFS